MDVALKAAIPLELDTVYLQPFLWMGNTKESFQQSGKTPVDSEISKTVASGAAIALAHRFNTKDGILSGPHPVEDFKLTNAESTVSGVTVSCEAVEETRGTF